MGGFFFGLRCLRGYSTAAEGRTPTWNAACYGADLQPQIHFAAFVVYPLRGATLNPIGNSFAYHSGNSFARVTPLC
jgi:hypothetical protein